MIKIFYNKNMAIELEARDELIAVIPGVYQEDIHSLFHQAVVGLTDDGIVIYNDQLPDSSSAGVYIYNIKAKLAFTDFELVVFDELKGKKDLIYKKKLGFIAKNQDNSIIFFVGKEGYKYINRFLKEIKKRKIHIVRRKTKVEL